MKIEIIQLIDNNSVFLKTISDWNYEWWGREEWFSYKQMLEHFKYSLNTWDKLPQTFIAIKKEKNKKDEVVWMYRISPSDANIVRPDIFPLLSSLYVDEEYRGNWIGKLLMEHAVKTIRKMKIKEIFLYTDLEWFYEKFWWEYIWEIETFEEWVISDKLYKLKES